MLLGHTGRQYCPPGWLCAAQTAAHPPEGPCGRALHAAGTRFQTEWCSAPRTCGQYSKDKTTGSSRPRACAVAGRAHEPYTTLIPYPPSMPLEPRTAPPTLHLSVSTIGKNPLPLLTCPSAPASAPQQVSPPPSPVCQNPHLHHSKYPLPPSPVRQHPYLHLGPLVPRQQLGPPRRLHLQLGLRGAQARPQVRDHGVVAGQRGLQPPPVAVRLGQRGGQALLLRT